ncbi:GlcG/HbpS family heme-binding protein [Pseudomonas sp.]|uniref:GlcG/HbpS family heme-binding protein n=1 Tax=Pseudomonas sp. TaxID=306 RepID=UPI003C4F5D90
MRITGSISLLLTLAVASTFVVAADTQVAQRKDVTLALANNLASASLAACHAQGRTAVVAVVDRGGNLVAVQRDDNVGPHNTLAAQRKAYTALSTKTPTRLLAERARSTPDAENLNTLNELLLLGGGVPLLVDGEVIGALGVAGAGGAAFDEGCALAAISKTLPATH